MEDKRTCRRIARLHSQTDADGGILEWNATGSTGGRHLPPVEEMIAAWQADKVRTGSIEAVGLTRPIAHTTPHRLSDVCIRLQVLHTAPICVQYSKVSNTTPTSEALIPAAEMRGLIDSRVSDLRRRPTLDVSCWI